MNTSHSLPAVCLSTKIFYKTSRIIFHHLLGENDIVDFFVMTRIDKLTGEFGQVESVHLRYLCAYEKLKKITLHVINMIFRCLGVITPHRTSLKIYLTMYGGNRTYDLWNASPTLCQLRYAVRSGQPGRALGRD